MCLSPSQLRGVRLHVVVTGGAGFIGSHLCEILLGNGHAVSCLDSLDTYYDPAVKLENIHDSERSSMFRFVQGDILDRKAVDEALAGFEDSGETVVVHLAGLAGVRPSAERPTAYMRVNVEGTSNVLERSCRAGVSHFLMASTSAVYGASAQAPFNEDQKLSPQESVYGASKRAAEIVCATYQLRYQLPLTVFRFFTAYGPRQRPDMAIHKFAKLMLNEQPVPVFGDGSSARDYTYVSDIVDGIVRAIDTPDGYRVFNLGSDRPVRLDDLVQKIATAVGVRPLIERFPDQPGDVPITWADISNAQGKLGYRPAVKLEDGLARFVTWMKDQSADAEGVDAE